MLKLNLGQLLFVIIISIAFTSLRAEESAPVSSILLQPAPPPEEQPPVKTTWDEIKEGILSSFSFSYEEMRRKELQEGFTIGSGITIPLKRTLPRDEAGFQTQGEYTSNYAVFASVTYVPVTFWFWNVTAIKYLDNKYKAPWDPEFTYRFGYDDWHPYTFSLVYGNYSGNRLFPDREKGEVWTNFAQGTITLGWKFPEPKALAQIFLFDSSAGINHSINYNVTPRYTDISGKANSKWKQSISFSTRYTIYEWLYWNFSLFYYPKPSQQQPWDPDFTYGFGYFDWHRGTVTVQYNNYAGNRYPWRDAGSSGGFLKGSFLISSSWTF